jgi:hypothetical protein
MLLVLIFGRLQADVNSAALPHFQLEHALPEGRLIIRPAEAADVGAASVLLTRAFAASPQGMGIKDGRKYCREALAQPPRGVLLVARLLPIGAHSLYWR